MVALQGSLRNMFYISIIHMHIFFVLKQALRKKYAGHAVVAHAFNRRTQEAEAGGSLKKLRLPTLHSGRRGGETWPC